MSRRGPGAPLTQDNTGRRRHGNGEVLLTDAEQAFTVELGKRLRVLRRIGKRTEQAIADHAGLSVELLQSVEEGRAAVSPCSRSAASPPRSA